MATPGAGKLVWFEIPVTDFERAKAFYGEMFGWKFEPFEAFSKDYWMIEAGENAVNGGLVKKGSSMPSDSAPVLYFNVVSIPAALERAKHLGAKIIKDKTLITDTAGYFAQFLDLDGNLIAIWCQN